MTKHETDLSPEQREIYDILKKVALKKIEEGVEDADAQWVTVSFRLLIPDTMTEDKFVQIVDSLEGKPWRLTVRPPGSRTANVRVTGPGTD